MSKLFVMKRLLLTVCVSFSFIAGFAQAYEGTIEYDKKKQQAYIIDYPYPPEAVENAIVKKMEELGYKPKEEKGIFNKDKGFKVFRNAFITDISDKSMDYIVKVEPKSKRDKESSVLYLVINKNGENVSNSLDAYDVGRAKGFLNNLAPGIEQSSIDLQIIAQEESIAKAEKKLKKLRDDKKDMEDKIKKLESDINTNIKDQESTDTDINNQRLALDALRSRKKN